MTEQRPYVWRVDITMTKLYQVRIGDVYNTIDGIQAKEWRVRLRVTFRVDTGDLRTILSPRNASTAYEFDTKAAHLQPIVESFGCPVMLRVWRDMPIEFIPEDTQLVEVVLLDPPPADAVLVKVVAG